MSVLEVKFSSKEIKKIFDETKKIKDKFIKFSSSQKSKKSSEEEDKEKINLFSSLLANYEILVNYYRKNNSSPPLIICPSPLRVKEFQDLNFSILREKKKEFENEVNSLFLCSDMPKKNREDIEIVYKLKIEELFKENKRLADVINKLSSSVISSLQETVNVLSNENQTLRDEREKVISRLRSSYLLEEELKGREDELEEMNKQQISYMSNLEKMNFEVKRLKEMNQFNLECLSSSKKELQRLSGVEQELKRRNEEIKDKEENIKIIKGKLEEEEKNVRNKNLELENFRKWAKWDDEKIDLFKKVDELTASFSSLSTSFSDSEKENKKLKAQLDESLSSISKLKKENDELFAIRLEYEKNKYKINGYDSEVKIREKLEKEKKRLEDENKEIKEKYDKTNNELSELKLEFSKKEELVRNIKNSYSSLLKRFSEGRGGGGGGNNSSSNSSNISNNISNNSNNVENVENCEKEGNDNSEADKNSNNSLSPFIESLILDYLLKLYIGKRYIEANIRKLLEGAQIGKTLFFGLNNIGNMGIDHTLYICRDVLFAIFDKLVSKKLVNQSSSSSQLLSIQSEVLSLAPEVFDDALLTSVGNCIGEGERKEGGNIEEIIDSIYRKVENMGEESMAKEIKNFIKGNLNKKLIEKIGIYEKNIEEQIKILAQILVGSIKESKVIWNGKLLYDFKNYFSFYFYYSSLIDRNSKIDIDSSYKGNKDKYINFESNPEYLDNYCFSLKYYKGKILRLNQVFTNDNNTNEEDYNVYSIFKCIVSYKSNLKQLILTNNRFNKKTFNDIVIGSIKYFPDLLLLNLSGNGLDDDDIKNLCNSLKITNLPKEKSQISVNISNNIKILYINDNNLTSVSGYYIADLMLKNNKIESLNLNCNNVNKEGIVSLINVLVNNKNNSLLDLDISYNHIGEKDINDNKDNNEDIYKIISDYLSYNPKLKSLNLSGNQIDPHSANLIGVSLKKNTNLLQLKLNECDLNEEGIMQLFNYLNETGIKNLEINKNKFKGMDPVIILTKLKNCKNLISISMQYIEEINDFLIDFLTKSSNFNPSLQKINLKNNTFSEKLFEKFASNFNNPNLIIIFSKSGLPKNYQNIIEKYSNNCFNLIID